MTETADLSALLTVDRLIHEPSRLVLLAILNTVERADFTYLSQETGLTKGNLSSHLSKLEGAGYITIEKTYRGKTPLTLCQITAEGTAAFDAYVEQIQQFLRLITG
jgi:DNA-binding MarR family transcriptional regulator